jgi:hypothetical protein
MNLQQTQPLVDGLIALWEQESQVSNAALESEDSSLPFDYNEVGDDSGAAAALEAVSPPSKHALIVAEGDSWFDYPIKGDLLDVLRKKHGYTIHQVSKAGALMEDMVYGSERRFWAGSRPQMIETMSTVAKLKPSLVLISGGGNDIAGAELAAFINRKAHNVDPLREEAMDHMIFSVFRRAYDVFIGAIEHVSKEGDFPLKILGHNYDFPNPDGRGYSITGIIPGFSYVGPWLKPTFDRKGYSVQEGRDVIRRILEKFTRLQKDLTVDYPNVFYTVDLQGTLTPDDPQDWDNEMHPTWSGFVQVGLKTHAAIQHL